MRAKIVIKIINCAIKNINDILDYTISNSSNEYRLHRFTDATGNREPATDDGRQYKKNNTERKKCLITHVILS